MSVTVWNLATSALFLAGVGALGACTGSDDGGPRTIVEERTTSTPSRPARVGATPEQRFGFGPMLAGSEPVERDLDPGTLPFAWDVPAGWESRPPTNFRLVNLVVADDPRAECYVSLLPGEGGGLTDNVNRWRAQMDLAPVEAEIVSALPRIAMFGTGATLVDLSGPYEGMTGVRIEDARMLGAILALPEFTLYVKMTGPADVVERERRSFEDFCRTLRVPDAAGHQALATDEHAGHDHAAGEGHGAAPGPPANGERRAGRGAFAWTVPAGWVDAAGSSMRLATYRPEGSPTSDLSVTLLSGDGGGLVANVNRWLGQFGAPALDETGVAQLDKVEVLGREAVIVEAEGPYTDMRGVELGRQALLGMVCVRGSDSLFVKLVGPPAEIEPERERFIAFVESLEVRP